MAEKTDMLTYIEECKSVIQSIFLYEKADLVGWLRLQPAVVYIKDFVKEASYVESELQPFRTYAVKILPLPQRR